MNSKYVMSIDAGTGSCRALIFDTAGNQISTAQLEWAHPTLPEFPGSQVFDTENNWKLISDCVRHSLASAGIDSVNVQAVSATSMREGMVLYDGNGREIWACPNVDSRANQEATYLVKSGRARKIYFTAGDWVSITCPPRFLWIKKNEPDVFRRIAHCGMLSDWILFKLTGEFVTDPSIGSSSGMFDLSRRNWSEEIIAMCGLKPNVFPEAHESGSIIGKVTKKAAEDTGLKEGTLVAVGGADTQLGLLGIGVTDVNRVTVMGGSFWQHTILLDRPVIDRKIRLRTLCHALPNLWMMEGIGFYCGLTMRWFRDAFYQSESEEARRNGKDMYSLMEREATNVPPGSNGVLAIFSNIMNSRKWIHAPPSFLGFDITNPKSSGKKECIRAIEESAGYVSKGHLSIIESIVGRKVKEIVFTGGGAKGFLWPQILADVLNVRVRVPVVKESTALGAAICAGVGAGFYQNLFDAAKQLARVEKEFQPSKDAHKTYERLYQNWRKVYDESLRTAEKGLMKPLWRAAGA